MTYIDDLIVFVKARLDEDEATANANSGARPGLTIGLGDTEEHGPNWPDYQTYDSDDLTAANQYLDRFRPLRMLREVAAKRAIVAECESFRETAAMMRDTMTGVGPGVKAGCDVLGDAVQMLAAAWVDHPEYRSEWAP